MSGFAIAVDLGTSNTVAILRWPDGRTRPLLVDGAPVMTSGVYLDESGRLLVGRDAQRMAQLEPARFEPNPKRRVDESTVLLGEREVSVVDLLAAVLSAVARAAVEAVGFLPPAVLTYPAAWGQPRRDALLAAATRAGWPPVRLVPEPVAAARYFVDVLRRPVPLGASLAVFDFGGGTLDVAVVRHEGGGFTVQGTGGVLDLGGLDVDAALVAHLGSTLAARHAQTWATLTRPTTATERRARRLFWEDVRGAKEMLSRTTVAPVAVPGVEEAVHLTREELEAIATPLLRRAVYETAMVVQRSGLRPDQLAGLFLVGGSSRLPVVARLLHAELGVAPTVLEQPELPVAEGALAELARVAAAPVLAGLPVSGLPVSGPPVSGPPAPVYAAPDRAAPPVGAPQSPAPVSGPPVVPGPVSGPPAPVSAAPYAPASASGPAGPPVGGPPVPPPARLRRPVLLAAAAAAAVVLAVALVVVLVVVFRSDGTVDFVTLDAVRASVPIDDAGNVSYTFTYPLGDRAYVGWVHDKTFHLGALDLAAGKRLFASRGVADADQWTRLVAYPEGVVLTGQSGSGQVVYVLDPDSGADRWHTNVDRDDQLLYYDSTVVVATQTKGLRGLDWRTGRPKWTVPPVADQSEAKAFGMGTAADAARPGGFDGVTFVPDLTDDQRVLQVTGDKTLRVYDARTGHLSGTRLSVGRPDDGYVAYAGTLFVGSQESPYQIEAYDLASLGEPQVVYTAHDPRRQVRAGAPCGDGRICVLDSISSDDKTTEIAAIDVAAHKELWRRPAHGTDTLVPVGDRVLATNVTGEPASVLYDPDGRQLLKPEDQHAVGVRVTGGSLLLFSASPSTSTDDVSLVGVSAADGGRTALGQVPKVRAKSCTWTDRYLVCPTDKDFEAWRFAK